MNAKSSFDVFVLVQCIVTYYLLGLQYGFGWFYLITVLVALNASSSAFLFGSFFSNSEIANAFFMFIVQPQINFTGMWSSIYFIVSETSISCFVRGFLLITTVLYFYMDL